MNILFDINVILDAIIDREPFGKDAALLFNAVEENVINGFIYADSITTVFYLIQKAKDKRTAFHKVKLLLEIFEVASLNRAIMEESLVMNFTDFEDSVVYQAGVSINANGIVTCNPKNFKKSKIALYSPTELLAAINYS